MNSARTFSRSTTSTSRLSANGRIFFPKSVRAFRRARLKMRSDFGQPLVFSTGAASTSVRRHSTMQVTPNWVSVWRSSKGMTRPVGPLRSLVMARR